MANTEPLKRYKKDLKIVDYDYQFLDGCSFALRGPLEILPDRKTIACLGSAATFGRFARKPYAHVLLEAGHWNVVNLGMGGARFETFLREPSALNICKNSDLVILELMSARSYRSHIFEPRDHLGGNGSLGRKYAEKIRREQPDSKLLSDDLFVNNAMNWAVKNLGWKKLEQARNEILHSYRDDAIELIKTIRTPVLLLWLSQRSPDQQPARGSTASWNCGFPHFVDRDTINAILPHTLGIVEVISTSGIPSLLTSLKTGKPILNKRKGDEPSYNAYYPSPQMHIETGKKLLERVESLLK